MAGLGRRTFAPGEVLTASNVMNYLQDQAVMNFAGTAARGSAIGSAVSEGMVSYLADSNIVEVYDGSAWKQISATTGNVLQVLQTSKLDTFASTSATYTDVTGLSVTITPKSVSNKVLIICSFMGGTNTTNSAFFQIVGGNSGNFIGDAASNRIRSATSIGMNVAAANAAYNRESQTIIYLDSPATTSATTYKLQGRSRTTADTFTINRTGDDSDDTNRFRGASSITAIEIAG